MRRTPRWSQLRLGLAVLSALVAVALGIFFVDRLGRWVEYRYRLHVYTESARNLAPGSPVWLAGVRVGEVWRIGFRGPETPVHRRLAIEVRLRRDVQPLVPEGSTARVITAGLLGEAVLDITPAATDARPLPDGAELIAGTPIDFPEIAAQFQALRALLPDVAARFATLRTRAAAAPHLDGLLRDGRDGVWAGALDDLAAARARFAGGSLHRLAGDPDLLAGLGRVARAWGEIADASDGTLGRLAGDTALRPPLESAARRAARLRARLEAAEGTAGRLLYDRELWIQWERARRAVEPMRAPGRRR